MEEINNLIVVESLPVIKQKLQIISDEVDKEIDYALSLECTEETKTEVKIARARLNKINTILDDKRKQVKKAILTPYEEFECIYNELVKDKLKVADNTLKTKINTIEEEQLKTKREELIKFAEEYFKHYDIEFCKFEDIGINVTLSASMKSLQEKVLEWVSKINNDIMVINQLPDKEEILYEYKNNGYNQLDAVTTVTNRKKALEQIKLETESKAEEKEIEQQMVEQVDEIVEELTAPVEIEATTLADTEEQFVITFTVKASKTKLKELREWMKENEISYE